MEIYGKESPIDRRVLNKVSQLLERGDKAAFVTGRACWYLEENLLPPLKELNLLHKVLVLGEWGLYKVENGIVSRNSRPSTEFASYKKSLKAEIMKVAQENRIPVKEEESRKIPETGEMWFEDRADSLSVRTNHYNREGLVTEDRVYEITVEAIKRLGYTNLDVVETSLSTVVKFKELNKTNMARYVLETFDPNNDVDRWYVFGDSPSDEEMVKVSPEKMVFVNVRGKASAGVLERLNEIS